VGVVVTCEEAWRRLGQAKAGQLGGEWGRCAAARAIFPGPTPPSWTRKNSFCKTGFKITLRYLI
jgi:hypothetical protein